MTRKYTVASLTMVRRIIGTLKPSSPDLIVRATITRNTEVSVGRSVSGLRKERASEKANHKRVR